MTFTIQLHEGPLDGQRRVIADDVLPPEVVLDGDSGEHLHYVRTGGAHDVNGGPMTYGYAFAPESTAP